MSGSTTTGSMDRDDASGLELRLVAGLHAGASVSLAPGQSVTVGRSRDCDVVLHDAPFNEARLEALGDTWLWLEPDGTRQQFRAGGGLRAGSLVLTVDRAGADWLEANQIAVAWSRPPEAGAEAPARSGEPAAAEPESAVAALDLDSREGAPGSTDEQTLTPKQNADPPAGSPGRRASRAWVIGPAVVVAGLAWYGASVLMGPDRDATERASGPNPQGDASASTQEAARDADLVRVQQRIAEGGFNEVVRARLRPDGRIEVAGVLESADEQDELIRLLSVERRWLALNLLTQVELAERLREVRRMLPEGLDAVALPGGRIALSGLNLDGVDSGSAQSLVERQIPQAVAIINRLTTPGELAVGLTREAQSQGFPSLAIAWADARLTVSGSIPRERTSDWEQFLRTIQIRYGERVPTRVALSLADPAPPAPLAAASPQPAPPPPKLPRIVAIQSGAASYLLFADGHRILPGGIINGYRLMAIGDEELVFEDSGGNQYRVPR